jgi:hypothetical protein
MRVIIHPARPDDEQLLRESLFALTHQQLQGPGDIPEGLSPDRENTNEKVI